MPLPPPPPNLFARPPALPPPSASSSSSTSDSASQPPQQRPIHTLSSMLGAPRGLPRPPIGLMSSAPAAAVNLAPKVPRDLEFGLLYSKYICPPSPKTPLFDFLTLRASMRYIDQVRSWFIPVSYIQASSPQHHPSSSTPPETSLTLAGRLSSGPTTSPWTRSRSTTSRPTE